MAKNQMKEMDLYKEIIQELGITLLDEKGLYEKPRVLVGIHFYGAYALLVFDDKSILVMYGRIESYDEVELTVEDTDPFYVVDEYRLFDIKLIDEETFLQVRERMSQFKAERNQENFRAMTDRNISSIYGPEALALLKEKFGGNSE